MSKWLEPDRLVLAIGVILVLLMVAWQFNELLQERAGVASVTDDARNMQLQAENNPPPQLAADAATRANKILTQWENLPLTSVPQPLAACHFGFPPPPAPPARPGRRG